MRRGLLLSIVLLWLCPPAVHASGHGPLFGAATPTLGKGGWQLDQAWMLRLGNEPDTREQALRTMVSFGMTEDVQISASLPVAIDGSLYMPRGRMMAMMSSATDVEAIAGWRFHRRATGSARIESTVFVGGSVPLTERAPDGMRAAPSFHIAASSGYASRTHYLWVGGGYHRHGDRDGDRMGDVGTVSLVYGYRPPALRLDYPKPDLRFFVEALGEHTSPARHEGVEVPSTSGPSVLVGPSALLLYKAYGLEAGILFPVFQRTDFAPEERFRAAVNFSWFFWLR
jgi:hypothetical protein